MRKGNKILLSVLALFGMVFMMNQVHAEEKPYWQTYFENLNGGDLPAVTLCTGTQGGVHEWTDLNLRYLLVYGGCGSVPDPYKFSASYYTASPVFVNVENVTVKSSDESIMTGEARAYDFSKEKAAFNQYIEYYNKATLEEIKQYSYDENIEELTEKSTWWKYNGYDHEITWWEAYGFDAEPTNAVEVVTHAKDVGNATLTVSAKDKEDIQINWTMSIVEDIDIDGITQLIKNLDRYKDNMPGGTTSEYDPITNKYVEHSYTFSTDMNEDDDLSELINALKGKDITVYFKGYSSIGKTSYYLNGKDITSTVSEGFTYDNTISAEKSVVQDKLDGILDTKDAVSIYIDFTYHGNLPAPYTLSVDMWDYIYYPFYQQYYEESQCAQYEYKENATPDEYEKWQNSEEGKKWSACDSDAREKAHQSTTSYFQNAEFTLLYYNPETDEMEVVTENLVVNENGKLELTFDHFSSYVLVDSEHYSIQKRPVVTKPEVNENQNNAQATTKPEVDKAPNNAQTSSINIILYSILALISLLGITYLTLSKKKEA